MRSKLKNSPLKIDCQLLNSQIFSWLEIINDRVHGTLKQKPKDLFEIEKKALLPLLLAVEPKNSLTTSKSNYTSKHRIESIDKECVIYQHRL
ncbi:hypothetical protein [Hydrogenimonas thermophila]|uniref:hypothetical protein n=1 Tax=Hydrogenimonas thermophila TaxID=223786 RepID=UPI0029371409|nr:hypothetical protein [Hydrogenimonas thermophila]WOE68829.1 hypothetical protein RZR91_06865 [Hydrogenimonas thermophila]